MSNLKGALAALRSQKETLAGPRHAESKDEVLAHLSHLSQEQREIPLCGARIIKVQAYAGTGKTTVLQAFAEQSSKAKGVYLTFNTGMAQSARRRFPAAVDCKTHNALALQAIKRRDASWRGVGPDKIGNMDAGKIRAYFKAEANLAKFAIATLMNFIHSMDDEIDERHFPAEDAAFLLNAGHAADAGPSVALARAAWDVMKDANSSLPMPHDGYLKMWAIAPGQLPYDYILVDESQDSNPAFLQGMSQQRCRQIFVGDEHQGIYAFRGAVNALDAVRGAEEFTIRSTRRFGSEISQLANAAISLKGQRGCLKSIESAPDSLVIAGRAPLGTRPLYLARTNGGLFEKALGLAKQGKDFHLLGDGKKFNFPDLPDLIELHGKNVSPGNAYAAFDGLDALIEAAESSQRQELAMRAKLVRRHGPQMTSHLALIKAKALAEPPPPGAQVDSLSTVHQAKGLESPWVELLDDFPKPSKATGRPSAEQVEEANILYVAITRAQQGLATGEGDLQGWAASAPQRKASREIEQDLF